MRPIERIDNFIKLVDWNALFKKWGLEFDNKKYYYIENFYKLFLDYWKANPDQRIGQVLINLGIIDDSIERWSEEEHSILIDQGIPPEKCIYWGSIYDKDGNPLEEPAYRLISDLSTDHILNIISFMKLHRGYVPHQTMNAFSNTLKEKGVILSEEQKENVL